MEPIVLNLWLVSVTRRDSSPLEFECEARSGGVTESAKFSIRLGPATELRLGAHMRITIEDVTEQVRQEQEKRYEREAKVRARIEEESARERS
jgi:hypothetical protein